MMIRLRRLSVVATMLLASSFTLEPSAQTAAPSGHTAPSASWFARIGETSVPADEYQNAVRQAYRNKFYHGQPPEAQVAALWRDVGQEIIDRILLVDEARRRGITADVADVQAQIDAYEKRYSGSPNWATMREKALPPLRKFLEEKTLPKQLEDQIRNITAPSREEVLAYYESHKELFTEPDKLKLSLILLKVDPSSPKETWEAAMAEGKKIHQELKNGADFATLARERSGDRSAANGGDLGYTHVGMLPEGFQAKVNDLKPGMLAEPTRSLEGIVIYRLEDRIVSTLRPFDAVAERAGGLLKRELAEKAWKDFLAALRKNGKIEIAPEFRQIMAPPAPAAKN